MKTFTVAIAREWQRAFGQVRTIDADYCKVTDGALLFYEMHGSPGSGFVHFLAGGGETAQPRVMVNEFPAGFWSSVTPDVGEPGVDK